MFAVRFCDFGHNLGLFFFEETVNQVQANMNPSAVPKVPQSFHCQQGHLDTSARTQWKAEPDICSAYFCLFVMWTHICVSLPSLFIERPLQQSWGPIHWNLSWCKDWHMVAGFSLLLLSIHPLLHLPWLSMRAPHCVPLSPFYPSHSTLLPCRLPESHTFPRFQPCESGVKANTSMGLTHSAKKMPTSAKWEGCFRREGNPSPALRGSCVVSTWSLRSVPAVQAQAQNH